MDDFQEEQIARHMDACLEEQLGVPTSMLNNLLLVGVG